MTMNKNFKAIIVGGGPIGLITAHALSNSGIDYVVLEKGAEVAPTNGSGHMIFPNTWRFLEQIGIREKIAAAGKTVSTKSNYLKDGTPHGDISMEKLFYDNHGYACMYFQRSRLIQALYDALPATEQAKVKTNSKVADIQVTEKGVTVTLANGQTEEGSIVIGCDGVYSEVRQKALDLTNAANMSKKFNGLKYVSNSRCYVFRRDWPSPDPDRCQMWETRSNGLAAQGFPLQDSILVALFQKLDKPKEGKNRYSKEEQEEFKNLFRDMYLTDKLTVDDIMKEDKINWDFFADQEEGKSDIVQYGGRIVLAGDSYMKITPITGLGLNMGIQQVIALANRLAAAVHSANEKPSTSELEAAFEQYREDCDSVLNKVLEMNTIIGDGVTWANWPAYIIDRILAPWVGMKFIMTTFYSKGVLRHGQLLDSKPKDSLHAGKIAWVK